MNIQTNGVLHDTETSQIRQQYDIRYSRKPLGNFETIGFERLYKTTDGGWWIHERYYRNGGGDQDTAAPLTEDKARAWLRDRFGRWKKFGRLEKRVFGG